MVVFFPRHYVLDFVGRHVWKIFVLFLGFINTLIRDKLNNEMNTLSHQCHEEECNNSKQHGFLFWWNCDWLQCFLSPLSSKKRKTLVMEAFNVCQTREFALRSYIPFPLIWWYHSFFFCVCVCVFLFSGLGKMKIGEEVTASLAPEWGKKLQE